LHVAVDQHHIEKTGRGLLLEMCDVRRGLEPRPAAAAAMVASRHTETIRELQELIAALDRRLPQVRRAGEDAIARDAAALKIRAQRRIEELEDDDRHT
jgi:hypothetical protein